MDASTMNARVHAALRHCLFEEEELPAPGTPPDGAVLVDGLVNKFALHPGRLAEKKGEVMALLQQLPDDFMKTKGGGMSFLNMCVNRDGEHWAEHPTMMELLVVLGIATGQAAYVAPREKWFMFPGEMPYIVVNDG